MQLLQAVIGMQMQNQQQFMTYMQSQHADRLDARQHRNEGNIRVRQEIGKISGKNEEVLVEEYMDFEAKVTEARVTNQRVLYLFFKNALVQPAKSYVDAFLVSYRGLQVKQQAEAQDSDATWKALSDAVLNEVCRCVGMGGDLGIYVALRMWSKLQLKKGANAQEVRDYLLDLAKVRVRMIRAQVLDERNPISVRREILELNDKLQEGSDPYRFVKGRERPITNYEEWCDCLRQYSNTIGGCQALASADGGQLLSLAEPTGNNRNRKKAVADKVAPLNDVRQAAGAGRGNRREKTKGGGKGLPAPASKEALAKVPFCADCKGRHPAKECPDKVAKADKTWNAQSAAESGHKCMWKTNVGSEVVLCRSSIHKVAHHLALSGKGVKGAKGGGRGNKRGGRIGAVTEAEEEGQSSSCAAVQDNISCPS
jgi:hypothetical protein